MNCVLDGLLLYRDNVHLLEVMGVAVTVRLAML